MMDYILSILHCFRSRNPSSEQSVTTYEVPIETPVKFIIDSDDEDLIFNF